MKTPSRIVVLMFPLMAVVCASTARATPNADAGSWDPREIPATTLLQETQMARGQAHVAGTPEQQRNDSGTKSKAYVPTTSTQVVGKGGVALTPPRADGRGLFYGNMAGGVISRNLGLVLRLF